MLCKAVLTETEYQSRFGDPTKGSARDRGLRCIKAANPRTGYCYLHKEA